MRRRDSLALALALGLSGGAIGCRTRDGARADAGPAGAVAAAPARPVRIVYPAAPGSFVDLAREATGSVVTIRSSTKVAGGPGSIFPGVEDELSLGSGFLIDSEGYILTNHHVIAHGSELRVVLGDGQEVAATVVGRDAKLDVGLLKIAGSPRLRAARLGDSDEVQVGEWVIAVGNPFGHSPVVSAGIISALDRTERDSPVGRGSTYRTFLQTDAVVNAASSGGPLINTAGEVIGIATAIDHRAHGTGFAVPINRAKQIVPMLVKDGVVTRTWLGIFMHPVSTELARRAALDGPRGVYVGDVVAGSPAHKAGLRTGDVILKFDGQIVDHRTLHGLSSTTGVGKRVPVVVWRGGGERVLELVSEKMPE